jgi:hypothetical protein
VRFSLLHRSPLAALAVTAGLLGAASAAQADSIVYIDGGNVWSAKPDGAAKVQLTTGGDWHSPTQADDGTIAAVQGTGPIRLLARDGRPVRTITTQPARSGDGGTFAPNPVELSLTPDGSRLAYAYVANSCPPGSTCGTVQRSTFYTSTNSDQATPQTLWGNQFGVSDPEWITNDRALVFGGSGSQMDIDPLPGGGDYSFVNWMKPDADMGDGELTRDMSKLVTTYFYGAKKILVFWMVNGDPRTQTPPPAPTEACDSTADENLADPTWSPDGNAIAMQSTNGIEVLRFTAFGQAACAIGSHTTLTPTGSEPDWGPADPPAARYADAPAAAAPAGATTTPAATPAPARKPAAGGAKASGRLVLAASALKLTALRHGKAGVRVTAGRAGRIVLRLSSGRTTIATGKVTVKRAGTVIVRLSRATTKALAALRGRPAALLSATLTTAGQERLEQSRSVRVK